ncbi:MAG TPA: DUF2059 domain-containing protein [Candidatus Acidoferrum sp.]|nr:DUF2059 domain-containing protein [Candidatus Acidoferrum sp.]
MKRSALALLICLVFSCASYAQQNAADAPASKEDIQRYLDAMHSREMTMNMLQAMKPGMHKMAREQMKDQPNLPPDFEARMDKMADNMIDSIPVDDLLQVMTPVYQKHFTKGDVDALVAFYSGPTGQKVLREMPAIMGEAMEASSGVMKKMMANMQQQIQDQIAQAQKQSGNSKDSN